jgi:phosphoglycerate-specific signal transduction histidine kinase
VNIILLWFQQFVLFSSTVLKECQIFDGIFCFHSLQGVVNNRFNEIVCVNNTGERDSVVQRIETYFADVDRILAELSLDV